MAPGTDSVTDRPTSMDATRGTFSNLNVINAPVQVFSVQNSGQLTMSNIHIDNSKGDAPLVSGGLPAAHNTYVPALTLLNHN